MRDPKFKEKKIFPSVQVRGDTQSASLIWELYPLRLRTLFVMVPLIDAINMMLPLFPKRAICLPAACAVYNTPFVLTPIT